MPVVQLQDDSGANLGSALGAAAGYFATQKQRKADKATATARQANLDAQNTRKNQDYHDEVTSKIQEAAGQEARTKDQDVNAQFQQAANAKAINLLSSPPAGQDPVQWAQHVWQQATTPPSSGGLGLTDSKMLGDLNAQVQAAVAKATQAKQQKFIQGEQVLPSDPKQALGVLGKRQQIEGGQGIDPKRTQDAITAREKQITEAQAAAYQNANLGERKRHDAAIENRPRGTGGGGESWSPAGNALYTQAMGMPTQQALALVDKPNSSITPKERAAIRTAIKDAKAPVVKTPENPDNESNANRIMQSSAVLKLPQADQADLNTNLRRYGYSVVSKHLQDIVNGKVKDPSTPPERAQRVLQAIQ